MPTSPSSPEPRETVKIVAELLQSQMQLEDDVISIYNQKRRLAPKSGLYIDVAIVGDHVYAANTAPVNDPAQPDLLEVQTAAQQEVIQIDIFSKDGTARRRRIEMVWALSGVAAQQAAEKYGLKWARVPTSFVDLSEVQGAARLNRYALTVNVLRSYFLSRTAPTFSTFENPPRALITNQ